jgi:hypothetical protein
MCVCEEPEISMCVLDWLFFYEAKMVLDTIHPRRTEKNGCSEHFLCGSGEKSPAAEMILQQSD